MRFARKGQNGACLLDEITALLVTQFVVFFSLSVGKVARHETRVDLSLVTNPLLAGLFELGT